MLLILEILLTVKAWRKGWRGWALLPCGISMTCGFFMGISAAASGGSFEDLIGFAIMCDLGALVALIVMVCKSPATATSTVDSNSAPIGPQSPVREAVVTQRSDVPAHKVATQVRALPGAIRLQCRICGQQYKAASKHAGRKGKCKKCGALIVVPHVTPVLVDMSRVIDAQRALAQPVRV